MKLKKILTLLVLSGAIPLVSVGLAACSGGANGDRSGGHQNHPAMQQSGEQAMKPSSTGQHDMMSMDLGPADEDFDLRFIDAMTPHHEGAIAMAEAAVENSEREQIRQLAEDIITAQQQEIQQLEEWRQAWYANAGEPVMYDAQMGHAMPMSAEQRASMSMEMELGAADNEFDLRFINGMIPHHEGAVDMAQQALEKSERPEIRELAESIVSSQQQEIDQMQQWRQEWYGQ